MEIGAYFQRIGYTGGYEVSLENLTLLIRRHLEAVPFENLDCWPSCTPLSNDPEVLFEKVVTRRRGGICFELNGLLHELLSALGYPCYSVAVRLPRPERPAAIVHQAEVVTLDGKQYYCDVGFGGPGPKGALALDADPVQTVDGEKFRVQRDGIYVNIQRYHEEAWIDTIRYADIPCIREDFTGLLYFASSAPGSYFTAQRIVNLCLPDGSLALTGNRFTARRSGEVIQRELTSEAEAKAVLEKEYGIYL